MLAVEEIDGRGIGGTVAAEQLSRLLLEGGKGRSEREGLQVHVGNALIAGRQNNLSAR